MEDPHIINNLKEKFKPVFVYVAMLLIVIFTISSAVSTPPDPISFEQNYNTINGTIEAYEDYDKDIRCFTWDNTSTPIMLSNISCTTPSTRTILINSSKVLVDNSSITIRNIEGKNKSLYDVEWYYAEDGWDCKLDKGNVYCDSTGDGNGDLKCKGGETCMVIEPDGNKLDISICNNAGSYDKCSSAISKEIKEIKTKNIIQKVKLKKGTVEDKIKFKEK